MVNSILKKACIFFIFLFISPSGVDNDDGRGMPFADSAYKLSRSSIDGLLQQLRKLSDNLLQIAKMIPQ